MLACIGQSRLLMVALAGLLSWQASGQSGRCAAPPVAQRPVKPWTGTIDAHNETIHNVGLSGDGHTLVTVGDWNVALWDLRTGKLVRRRSLREDNLTPFNPAFVSQDKEIACEIRNTVHILDRQTLKTRAALEKVGRSGTDSLVASPDGATVASARSKTLAVWDVAKSKVLWQKEFDKEASDFDIRRVTFCPDGKVLALKIDTNREIVRLLDVSTGRELGRIASKGKGWPSRPVFTPDGHHLVMAYRRDPDLEVWDVRTAELVRRVRLKVEEKKPTVKNIAISPDGKTLFVCCGEEGLQLYGTATWGLRHTIDECPKAFVVCPRGRLICWDWPAKDQVRVCSWRVESKAGRRTDEELARLWDDLGSKDAEKGFQSITELLATPEQSVALLARLLRVELTRQQIDRLIRELDDEDFDTRERASRKLQKAVYLAEAPLRSALADRPSLEVRRRISRLLKALDPTAPERLRLLRAVELLEALALPQAVKELERLAGGAEDAKAALDRLRRLAKQDEG